MGFDFLGWAVGYLLGSAADKIKDSLFSEEFKLKLRNEINSWTDDLPSNLYLHPDALFPETNLEKKIEVRPYLYIIQQKLEQLIAPTANEWFFCFKEHWEIKKTELGVDAQNFFKAEWDEVKDHLKKLSEKVQIICYSNSKIALNTLVHEVRELKSTSFKSKTDPKKLPEWVNLERTAYLIPTNNIEAFKISFSRMLLGSFFTQYKNEERKKVIVVMRYVPNIVNDIPGYEIFSNDRSYISFLRKSFVSAIRRNDFTETRKFETLVLDLINQGWNVKVNMNIMKAPSLFEFEFDKEVSILEIKESKYSTESKILDFSNGNSTTSQLNLMCRLSKIESSNLVNYVELSGINHIGLLNFFEDLLANREIRFDKVKINVHDVEEWTYEI